MNNNYLSIGEMAKMNHITVTTLRLYDELDLLKPVYVNPETNYQWQPVRSAAALTDAADQRSPLKPLVPVPRDSLLFAAA